MESRAVPRIAALTVSALLVATAVVMTWQGLALAGDGSYYLVRILATDALFGPDPRILTNAVRQAPVLLTAAVGVTDTHTLTIVHGAGQLFVPSILWSISILLTRTSRVAFAAVSMTAGLCAATTWFFSVSESVLAAPLTVVVAVLLWQSRSWRWGDVALACAASVVLIASYETSVLTGALLAVWASLRGRASGRPTERWGCAAVTVASAASVVVGILGVNAGPGPTNAQSFLYFVLSLDPWSFYLCLLGLAVLVAAMATVTATARWILLGVGATAVGIGIGIGSLRPTTTAAFAARGGGMLAALLLSGYLFWMWLQRRSSEGSEPDAPGWFVALPVAAVCGFVVTALVASTAWSRSLDAFKTEVDANTGVVVARDVLPTNRRRVLWDWTASSLSLLVRRSREGGVLVDVDPSYVPFAPTEARRQIPDSFVWRRW